MKLRWGCSSSARVGTRSGNSTKNEQRRRKVRKFFVFMLFVLSGLGWAVAQDNAAAKDLFTFANGTDTWAVASSNAEAGTAVQGINEAGAPSLKIEAAADGWFGTSESLAPLPLSTDGVTKLLVNISTTSEATSQAIAVQVGSNYQWCQSSLGYIERDKTTTITVNLSRLISAKSCGGILPVDTSEIHGIWVFVNGGGSYYLNKVQVR
jgi:hypothetical protein